MKYECIEVGPKKVWNSLEINEMIKDPDSGYSFEEGLLFEAAPSVNASDGECGNCGNECVCRSIIMTFLQ